MFCRKYKYHQDVMKTTTKSMATLRLRYVRTEDTRKVMLYWKFIFIYGALKTESSDMWSYIFMGKCVCVCFHNIIKMEWNSFASIWRLKWSDSSNQMGLLLLHMIGKLIEWKCENDCFFSLLWRTSDSEKMWNMFQMKCFNTDKGWISRSEFEMF